MLLGSIHHISITVADLPNAMRFFGPLLEFLGYAVGRIGHDDRSDHDLSVSINEINGTAFNVWQAEAGLADHPFEAYEPGCITWPSTSRNTSRSTPCTNWPDLGAEILSGPGEFPFGPEGYYAVYFRGPERLKFEIVHMLLAEQRTRALNAAQKP